MRTTKFGAVALAAAVLVDPEQAFGEEAGLEVVVVTAQRREQNLQDVGIAISVLSGEDLRKQGISYSTDLADRTPGLHMSGSLGGQSQQFSIRGVTQNDFNDSIEAPVAVYVDDGYIPTQQGQTLAMFDLARAEVLKGPQGTLFGRNATGGLVHFIVNQPTADFEGHADVSYGRFNEIKTEGAISGPLSQSVSARASVFYSRIDGMWDNVFPAGAVPGPVSFGGSLNRCCDDEGGQETYAGRVQLAFEPTAELRIRLVGSAAKRSLSTAPYTSRAVTPVVDSAGRVIDTIRTAADDTRTIIGPDGANYFNPTLFPLQGAQTGLGFGPAPGLRFPGATWFGYHPLDPEDLKISVQYARSDVNEDSSYNGALHVDYDFEQVQLASITNYMQFDKTSVMDASGSPQNLFQYGTDSSTWSASQEFRLSGSTDRMRWVGGLYYLHIDADGKDGLLGSAGSLFAGVFGLAASGVDPITDRTLKTDSTSVFGQIEYDFAPDWTLIVGARAINEQQEYELQNYAALNENDYAVDSSVVLFPLPYPPFEDERTQHLYAGKLQIEYRPTDDLLLFVGGNRGVKAGSYNAKTFDGSPALAPELIPYEPEVLTSIEGGFKWSAPRFTLGASAYHYDYKDYQAFLFNTNTGYVQNVEARTNGLEIDSTIQLYNDLEASLGYAYMDAEIPDYEIAPGVFKDVRPTFSSEHHASIDLTYTVPAPVFGGALELNGNASYSSSFFANLKNFAADELDGRTLANASVSWSNAQRSWRFTGFIKNIADERYPTIGFNSGANCGCSIESYGMPRTYGVTIGASF